MSSTVEDKAQHLLIEVDDFDNATGKTSYLRLGSVPTAIGSAYDALNDGGADKSAFTSKTGEDLASRVMTFIDDTRERGDGDFFTLTEAQRAAESKLLHTKGGWRDHTDGNRITTTDGDKVEVIGGNYKLLVLGREQWRGDAGVGLNHESSGGITYHFDEVPGQIIDVRRSESEGTWRVIEECSQGHFVARYHGVDKDWHQGGDVKLRVGSLGAYKVWKEGAVWADVKADHGFREDSDFDKPDDAAHQALADWPGDDRLPKVREEVFANDVKEKIYCHNVEEVDGDSDHWVDSFEEKTWATSIHEMQTFVYYEQRMTGVESKEIWEGLFFEAFICLAALTTKFGGFVDFRYGYLSIDTNLSYKGFLQVNVGARRTQLDLAPLRISLGRASNMAEVRVAAWHWKHENLGINNKGVEMQVSANQQLD